ncbi:unnamed protein product [Schistosoma rodhaini]|uniref:EF-hand domain-containing protein n=1 Tax=Schistosoma rodhaini TaxID=6188 RepID=A0AA85ESH7_9TREM|nr:unnamed protein product [Schistosoma rodhaini]
MTSGPQPHNLIGPSLVNKGGKAMDSFLDAFFALDTDNREVISLNDLSSYNKKHGLQDSFPETFLRRFDAEKTGVITLEQYCKALGLVPKQARELRRRRTTVLLEQLIPRDLEIIYDDMELEMKVKVMELFINDLRESGRKTNIDMEKLDQSMQRLKEYLDTRYGKSWHIITSINQHLGRFSYEPNTLFHFCLGRFVVLIWKTPCSA